ncbi:Hypothetical predicted protein [Marmota monax]|uniref:Uncharacterized protein n=1 Tax=Marmota monax TaxID=9995 RepID=A0A5E4CTS6_MARMO|nr:Hypothetical predicted protein [Marmota monax]
MPRRPRRFESAGSRLPRHGLPRLAIGRRVSRAEGSFYHWLEDGRAEGGVRATASARARGRGVGPCARQGGRCPRAGLDPSAHPARRGARSPGGRRGPVPADPRRQRLGPAPPVRRRPRALDDLPDRPAGSEGSGSRLRSAPKGSNRSPISRTPRPAPPSGFISFKVWFLGEALWRHSRSEPGAKVWAEGRPAGPRRGQAGRGAGRTPLRVGSAPRCCSE